ncbi:flavin containing amine oxidoreductase domain-containing protein [Ditylenchus destructor]|uniref:Pyridine nucleotide-disulfide oxidoreductase domain-containing protein 2 n=1 Tax=Ditylenchus destructor TaxID=166010 RepID=A0AAD4MF19_9BILA|nr:flavin containing amine oxidoreductase domain-containing protein [Ditylenchus destructor]
MKLAERGYRVIERPVSNFFPLEDGHLILGGGAARTQGEFARFSMKDAAALPGYSDALERVAEMLRSMALKTPPNAGGGVAALLAAAAQGRELAKMPIAGQRDALALFVQSAREFLDQWFENEHIKAAFAFDAVVGNFAGPSAPGSAYVLLHHVFGEVNGKKGAWGHPIGGMGAITGYMADAAREAGVEISLEAPVERVLVEPAKDGGGKVAGVRLASGEEIAAKLVVANVGPALLYRQMIDPSDLDEDFRRRIAGFKTGSGSFRMNVALSELPDFTCCGQGRGAPSQRDHHRADHGLYGPRTCRRGDLWLVERAGGGDDHPLDRRRQPGPAGRACRQPVLPAFRAGAAQWPELGRRARGGGGRHHRHDHRTCPQFPRLDHRPADPFAHRP